MDFSGISYLGVFIAAAGSFIFGAVYYSVLGKQWMAAIGMTEHPKPAPLPFITAAIAQLAMAYFLAGLIGHLGEVTIANAMITAFFIWLGFILTTLSVNHRFQGAKWSLTVIDAGHWLGGLMIQAILLGWFGT